MNNENNNDNDQIDEAAERINLEFLNYSTYTPNYTRKAD